MDAGIELIIYLEGIGEKIIRMFPVDKKSTNVRSNFISSGYYFMNPKDVEDMASRRIIRDYNGTPKKETRKKYDGNFKNPL